MRKYAGQFFIILSIAIIAGIWYANSRFSTQTRPFSSYTFLTSSWEEYKQRFINEDGRVIDHSLGDITTSEGQSYAMLRSVWIDDKDTFDTVWNWTKNTLRRENEYSFGWMWGKNENGEYGYIQGGGENVASDADQDIALALILAQRRWNDSSYGQEALLILNDLWENNTEEILGKRYLLAGNWANNDAEIIVNPSYFAPYAWKIFGEEDTEHDWQSLIDPAYEILEISGNSPLDRDRAVGLPPDWVVIKKETGELSAPQIQGLSTEYSYDAVRIPWRIALDYQWNNDPQALQYLEKLGYLSQMYEEQGKLVASYAHSGEPTSSEEGPTMYATAIGHFMYVNPESAEKIFQERIVQLYSNDTNSLRQDLPYYEQNWVWFGAALYTKQLSSFSGTTVQ